MQYEKIKKQAEFQKLFAKAKRAFTPSFTLLYLPSKELSMGISVGKRHGKSVQRNKIKRLVREAFRLNVQSLRGKYAFIFLPKVREEYTFSTFERDVRWIFKKEKL